MAFTFLHSDIPLLNTFLKIVNDAKRSNRVIQIIEIRRALEKDLTDHQNIASLPHIEDLIRGADTKLFSYGTLQPGQQNHHMLKNLPGYWRDGFVFGELQHSGWGSAFGFPVLTLNYSSQKPKVYGKLFTSAGLPDYWQTLDDFEGDDYIRLLTLVYTIPHESFTIASVYADARKVS